MSARSRSPISSAAADADHSLQMPRSPIELIEYTVTDPTVTDYDVFKAHEHLGEISNVEKKNSETFTVTFVHRIEEDAVAATASDDDVSIRQFADPPDQMSPAHIMNALNDDCLVEIFERLNIRDSNAIAHVCKRFRSIAVQIFQSRNRSDAFSFENWETTRFKLSLSAIVNFIRIFRPTRFITVDSTIINQNVILQATAAHCPNLTELDISHGDIDPEAFVMLRPLLPQLRKITIFTTDVLGHCGDIIWQLEELTIAFCGHSVMLNMQMPRLRKLIVGFVVDEQALFEFLARNSQLTEIKFDRCHLSWTRMCTLAECVPNIERLTICHSNIEDYDESPAPSIFKCLTMFEIYHCEPPVCFLNLLHGAPLKHLKLDARNTFMSGPFSYLIDSICRLTTISSLYLHPYFRFGLQLVDDHLVQMTNSLGCLRELHIEDGNFTLACIRDVLSKSNGIIKLDVSLQREEQVDIDLAVLDDISAIIAARPELHVKIHVSDACVTTPIDTLRPYTKWLLIEENCRRNDFLNLAQHLEIGGYFGGDTSSSSSYLTYVEESDQDFSDLEDWNNW